ncbi:class I SAM-dependent methyltransferase [Paraburkholderia sp. BCC1886]|uniref:class I SAM-dependent methyltransferase n=1 Tax=Paraburkholderia sp. BCC1886 TaxID=2562670 RepID=UPI0016424219|nr:class I SAM-dependent methyltransferase [Paraburkholderia sp. BCC1886]
MKVAAHLWKSNFLASRLSPRHRAALRYLGWADSVFRWRVSRADCPLCGGRFFLSLAASPFMTRCLSCANNATNLAIIPVVKTEMSSRNIDVAWEMSTYGAVLEFMRGAIGDVISSEFFPGIPSGERVDGVLSEDVQKLSFGDETLDLITSNQVFEHVSDDTEGYRECYRVLKKNGLLLFTVPLYEHEETKQLAVLTKAGVEIFGEPEYHDSRTAGPKSALTFWRHSVHDICSRVAKAGFQVQLVDVVIAPGQKNPVQVIRAAKH